jgi:hypothetical protein
MSRALYEFAKRFADGEIRADVFADAFIERWKQQRDSGPHPRAEDDDEMSERLSTIFCLADLYNPEADRADYELDEFRLRSEVRKALGL